MAFTCAHNYSRREYYDQLLPELRRRLEAWPTPMGLTASVRQSGGGLSFVFILTDTNLRFYFSSHRPAQILLADYYLPRMHVACPPCLFNGLRQDVIKTQPDLQDRIRAWAA